MVFKWKIAIPQLTGNEKRRLYLYLPSSYRSEPQRRYPVLYMFDGHNLFYDSDATYGKSWGLKEYMDRTKTQMIIVAPECNHHPENGRLSEYSPFTFDDKTYGHANARGQITMDWIVNELKPYIDNHYRTLPDRKNTFISGSSMGGLMALYAAVEYNHIFGKAAALSPSLWVNPDSLAKMITNAKMQPDTVLYMDYGQIEMQQHKGMFPIYARIMAQLQEKNILLTSRMIPNGEHCEANWEKQLPFVINTLLYH